MYICEGWEQKPFEMGKQMDSVCHLIELVLFKLQLVY